MTDEELLQIPVRDFSGVILMEDTDPVVMRDNGETWWVYKHEGQLVRTSQVNL